MKWKLLLLALLPSSLLATNIPFTDANVRCFGWTVSGNNMEPNAQDSPCYFSFYGTGLSVQMASNDTDYYQVDSTTYGVAGPGFINVISGLSSSTHTVYMHGNVFTSLINSTNTWQITGSTTVVRPDFGTAYPVGAVPFTTYGQTEGCPIFETVNGFANSPLTDRSSELSFEYYATGSSQSFLAINLGGPPYSAYALYSDGVQIGSFTVSAQGGQWQLYGISATDSGQHHYKLVQYGLGLNSSVAYIMPGGTLSTVHVSTQQCVSIYGDSIVALSQFTLAPYDGRLGWWAATNQAGFGIQRVGVGGSKLVPDGQGWVSHIISATPQQPQTLIMEYGTNDANAAGSTTTFKVALSTVIAAVAAGDPSLTHVLVEEILPNGLSEPANPAFRQAQIDGTALYTANYPSDPPACFFHTNTPNPWINTTSDTVGDALHPSYANPALSTAPYGSPLMGYGKIGNRLGPILAGYSSLGASYTSTGPVSGNFNIASASFTVTLGATATWAGDQTVTLNDGGAGGTFVTSLGTNGTGPLTVTPTVGTSSFTFTYKAVASGANTITYTNAQDCWTNPTVNTYTTNPSALPGNMHAIMLSTQSVSNASVLAQNSGADFPYRAEWCMHDWSLDITGAFTMNPIGLYNAIANYGSGDLRFFGYPYGESGGLNSGGYSLNIGTITANGAAPLPNRYYVARFQHDPATLSDIFQVWDSSGNLYSTQKDLYATYSYNTSNGVTLNAGGGTSGYQVDFFRIYNSTVPENYREPTSSDTAKNCVVNWGFDGNLTDSCTLGPYNATVSAGTAYYVNSPYQTLVRPVLHSSLYANAPIWDYEWPDEDASVRAGYPTTLDGTLSYSMADSSQIVSYQWAELSGPSNLTWNSHYISTPTINGLVYGDYAIQLTATDKSGNVGTNIQHVGAVATDSKDIVISSNPNVGYIFGPQLRFGSPKQPWGYADERQQSGSELNNYGTPTHYWTWLTTGTGTVGWTWGGLGNPGGTGGPGTTLTSNISSFTLTVPIADKTKLDFSSFPTRVVVYGGNGTEEMRVCSKTDTGGNTTTLNLCYDGRASSAYMYAFPNYWVTTPVSATSGVNVGQSKALGTNTLFLSDPNTALCTSAPSPMGTMLSSGTVTMTVGTTTILGINTGWAENLNQYSQCIAPYNACVGDNIVIQGTHASGTPFTFIATITTFIDSTHMQLSRVYPLDADNGTFSFQILNSNRLPDLYYSRAVDGSQGQRLVGGTGCESNTDFYFEGQYDSNEDGRAKSGSYSYKTNVGLASQYGPNFYGSGMAHRNLAYRSGLAQPLYRANVMDDYWCQDPEQDGGYAGGIALLFGGGAWGCYVDAATNPNFPYSFAAMRGYPSGTAATETTYTCNQDDTRDTGYLDGLLTLNYLYDTSSATWNTTSKQYITQMINRDTNTVDGITGDVGCKHNDNSWSNGFLFNTNGPKVEVTLGTTTVNAHAGSTFNASTCYDVGHGTMSVLISSYVVKGTNFPSNGGGYLQATITGTKAGQPYTLWTPFLQINSTTAWISAMWTGDTASSATYIIRSGAGQPGFATIAASPEDPLMKQNWSCYLNGPSSFTLQSPWTSATNTTGSLYLFDSFADASVNIAGYGQQPYMLGINMNRFQWLWHTPSSAFQAKAQELLGDAAGWLYSVGFSTDVGAINYGRVFPACEPAVPYGDTTNASAGFRNGGWCQPQGWNISSLPNWRQLNTEGAIAFRSYYDTSGSTTTAVAWADKLYGAIFGYAPWTTGGAFSDAYYAGPTSAMINAALASYKYFGQAFGVGNSSTYAAVRTGAVDAQVNRTINVGYTLPANATSANIFLTEPNGYVVVSSCTANVCPVIADARQGTHLMQIKYYNGSGVKVSEGDVTAQPVQ